MSFAREAEILAPTKEKTDDYRKKIEDANYIEYVTELWHQKVPETKDYQVCSMDEATHVIFTETDLDLAGEDGEGFTPLKIYPINRDESGDLYIIDDNNDIVIGFDLFIPCEYLKRVLDNSYEQNHRVLNESIPNNVICISEYFKKRTINNEKC